MTRAERFAQKLSYDPDTGHLVWKEKPSRGVKVGTRAGGIRPEGYIRLRLQGQNEYAHRIAWVIMTGESPPPQIDHRNSIKSDNRWTNLRAATPALNRENVREARKDSSSGLLGAMPNKSGFMARIRVRGSIHYLGTFKTAAEAHNVYINAKRKLHDGCTI